MSHVKAHISISLDGYAAGPNQSPEHPLGEGGEGLHQWAIVTEAWRRLHGLEGGERNADSALVEALDEGVGAHIMGRRMFGGGEGPWDESWKGWWGDEPPFHAPVFVLTHHERAPLEMQGGTTFTFVTDGVASALDQARAAAGEQDVAIAGGAEAIQQYLAAGLLDELTIHVAPVLLGGGRRLLENIDGVALEQTRVAEGSGVTHMTYRVVR